MKVFICYRRSDTGKEAQTLASHLVSQIGQVNVMLDILSLRPGSDFRIETLSTLKKCELVIVLVGPSWEEGFHQRHSEHRQDHVLLEILAAREIGLPIVPILIDRDGVPIDTSVLTNDIDFIADLHFEDVRSRYLILDFDSVSRRLSGEFPSIFGSSRAPLLLSKEIRDDLLRIPNFSEGAIRPASSADRWEKVNYYECATGASDDFRFDVYEDYSDRGVCFFDGYDDVTTVTLGRKNAKARERFVIDGLRSQYGFYWPQHYFTISGGYGARDYFYFLPFGSFFSAIWRWMLDQSNDGEDDRIRGNLAGGGRGVLKRGVSSQDVILFPVVEAGEVRWFSTYNGIHSGRVFPGVGRGTIIQWSQVGGGYKEYCFVLKDHSANREYRAKSMLYFGRVSGQDLSLVPIECAPSTDVYAHPSGVIVRVSEPGSGGLLFEFLSEDGASVVESVIFEGLGMGGNPDISFSRDGRHVAVSQPYLVRSYILDLFSGSIVNVLHEFLEPLYSPDGERLVALRAGRSPLASIFSKRGEDRQDLGVSETRRSMQFYYWDAKHFTVHGACVWSDDGRRIYVKNASVVTEYGLMD